MAQLTLGDIKCTQRAVNNTVHQAKVTEILQFTLDHVHAHTHTLTVHCRWRNSLWAQMHTGSCKEHSSLGKTCQNWAIDPRSYARRHFH